MIQDRAYIEEMKADILRRAEEAALADSEDEDEIFGNSLNNKGKGRDFAFEDEFDADVANVSVRDGDSESDEEDGDEDEEDEVSSFRSSTSTRLSARTSFFLLNLVFAAGTQTTKPRNDSRVSLHSRSKAV